MVYAKGNVYFKYKEENIKLNLKSGILCDSLIGEKQFNADGMWQEWEWSLILMDVICKEKCLFQVQRVKNTAQL